MIWMPKALPVLRRQIVLARLVITQGVVVENVGRRSGCRLLLLLGLLDGQALLRRLHVLQLLAHLAQPRLELVQSIVQGLDLARKLVGMSAAVALLLLQSGLKIGDRGRNLVGSVGALFDQVLQHAHALVERLLHVGNSVLQVLDLGLQLHHVFVDAPRRRRGRAEQGQRASKTDIAGFS